MNLALAARPQVAQSISARTHTCRSDVEWRGSRGRPRCPIEAGLLRLKLKVPVYFFAPGNPQALPARPSAYVVKPAEAVTTCVAGPCVGTSATRCWAG